MYAGVTYTNGEYGIVSVPTPWGMNGVAKRIATTPHQPNGMQLVPELGVMFASEEGYLLGAGKDEFHSANKTGGSVFMVNMTNGDVQYLKTNLSGADGLWYTNVFPSPSLPPPFFFFIVVIIKKNYSSSFTPAE